MINLLICFFFNVPFHALYLSTSKMVLAENQSKLEIQIKIFSDDLQTALANHFNEQEISTIENLGIKNLPQIKSYLKKHLIPNKVNNNHRWAMDLEELTADYQESIYLLTAVYKDNLPQPDKAQMLEIQADYLMEVFPTQSNVIDISYGEQRIFFRLTKNKSREQMTL
ncbi:MAG: DUF6702 family protein [Saprospiraceae bacterium]